MGWGRLRVVAKDSGRHVSVERKSMYGGRTSSMNLGSEKERMNAKEAFTVGKPGPWQVARLG